MCRKIMLIYHLCFVLPFDRRYGFEEFPFGDKVSRGLLTMILGILEVQAVSPSGNFTETSPSPSPLGTHSSVFVESGVLAK